MSVPPTPLSPNARKHKAPPALPLSVFTPPSTGTADRFPFPPSPTSVTAESIVDASVVVSSADLNQWKSEATAELKAKLSGVVLLAKADDVHQLVEKLEPKIADVPILSVSVPFRIENGSPVGIPSSSKVPVSLSTVYSTQTPEAVEALTWALSNGHIVDVDVQFTTDDKSYDSLEESLSAASKDANPNSAIVISNVLPPVDDLSLPLVKLLTHPTYQAYQAHTASLSLIPNTYIKFLPPNWREPTPPTPAPVGGVKPEDSFEKKEWKRRIKMYVGPALEAFGDQRIIFGTSPSPESYTKSAVGDWYELVKELLAELGIEQEGVDAIFGGNAQKVYGKKQ
ncbi:hypothetical protein BDM02DRAFT_3107195 [Thelephora ganbajun]|uniref:Uncharacterized protein n=1 Tax=Thelephora ganbajun TaxID=370292 RepID=A0ACB6ZWZ3_THEGA|nr:hypothetical protein BDM02DRAFT_3107195 [Thelephora ganbajun]